MGHCPGRHAAVVCRCSSEWEGFAISGVLKFAGPLEGMDCRIAIRMGLAAFDRRRRMVSVGRSEGRLSVPAGGYPRGVVVPAWDVVGHVWTGIAGER